MFRSTILCVVICVFSIFSANVQAQQSTELQCYNCLSQGSDNTCVKDPELVSEGDKIVACKDGWCTITRKEYTDMPGKIVTFVRGCELKRPVVADGVITDAHFTTHYRSCRTPKCNKGDGLTNLEGIGSGGPGNGTLIVVPEERNNSAKYGISLLLIILNISYSLLA